MSPTVLIIIVATVMPASPMLVTVAVMVAVMSFVTLIMIFTVSRHYAYSSCHSGHHQRHHHLAHDGSNIP